MGCRGGGEETLSQFRVTHCRIERREERRGEKRREIRLYEDLETTRERGDDLQIGKRPLDISASLLTV